MTVETILLVRPFKHRHERLVDYMKRLSRLNGFSSFESFANFLKVWALKNCLNSTCFYKADTYALYLGEFLQRDIQAKAFDRPAFDKENIHGKVCTACLSDNPATMFYWRIFDYTHCHIHRGKLKTFSGDNKSVGSMSGEIYHPIVDFLGDIDPWGSYSKARTNYLEIEWLLASLEKFYRHNLGLYFSTIDAQNWIEYLPLLDFKVADKFDDVMQMIASQTKQMLEDVRVVAALLFWRRMVPNHALRTGGHGSDLITADGLMWASHQMRTNEFLLKYIADSRKLSKCGHDLRRYRS